MKISLPRVRFRSPSPRVWLGIALVSVSVAGTVWVISDRTQGTGIVLATRFIPAGSPISAEDVSTGRATASTGIQALVPSDVVGHRAAVDLAEGDIVSPHDLDSTVTRRTVVAVPLGISPAATIASGVRVQLWFVPTDATAPPTIVSNDVLVIAARRGTFGEGDVLDVSVNSRDEDSLLTALGAEGVVVVTAGGDTM